ncbi:PAN domain-containing protein, partial [Toxoplasma gondii RUB]
MLSRARSDTTHGSAITSASGAIPIRIKNFLKVHSAQSARTGTSPAKGQLVASKQSVAISFPRTTSSRLQLGYFKDQAHLELLDPLTLYDCPPGFAIGEDQQCWEVDRSKYSLGKNAMVCQGGVFHRTLMDRCTPCPPGFSCHVEEKYTSWLTRCQPGSASYLGDAECVKCRAGYFCPGYMEPFWQPPLRRFPGWYESGYQSSTSAEVRKFRLQMQGYCGMGTYGRLYVDVIGRPGEYYATYNSTCATCPPGTFCYDVGIVNFQAYKCPAGHYCLGSDSIPVPCPPGKYNPFRGAMSSNACMTCPDGFDCETLRQKIEPELCPPGFICPFGRKKIACPAGTVNPLPGQSALEQCERCPAGYYCPNKAGKPKPCPSGTYNPFEGASSSTECVPCPLGFQCDTPGAVYYTNRCSAGGYCNAAGASPTLCPEGTWKPGYFGNSLMHCHVCPPGA